MGLLWRVSCLILTSDLSWSKHASSVCMKVRKIVGLIYRHFSPHSSMSTLLYLFSCLIRPHLEYAGAVWDPHFKRDIVLLENVQKYALRIAFGAWGAEYQHLISLAGSNSHPGGKKSIPKTLFTLQASQLTQSHSEAILL